VVFPAALAKTSLRVTTPEVNLMSLWEAQLLVVLAVWQDG